MLCSSEAWWGEVFVDRGYLHAAMQPAMAGGQVADGDHFYIWQPQQAPITIWVLKGSGKCIKMHIDSLLATPTKVLSHWEPPP